MRSLFFPRLDAESWPWRARFGIAAAIVLLFGLGMWLVLELTAIAPRESGLPLEFRYGLLALVALTDLGAIALLRRRRGPEAGYLLGVGLLLAGAGALLGHPGWFFVSSLAFPLAVLVVGALASAATAYLAASLAIVLLIIVWWWAASGNAASAPWLQGSLALSYLGIQICLYLGTAAAVHLFSSQLNRALLNLRQQAETLSEMAHTDLVTGLANRRAMVEQLDREFLRARRYRRPLSLLYLDLDGFKSFNDRFGHLFGDEILRSVATNARAVLRSTDLLARIGGDEFAVLLPETALEGAEKVAAKLHKALSSYSQHLGPAVTPLSFCAGVSQIRESDSSVDDLLSRADQALYLAKGLQPGSTATEKAFDEAPPASP
jgi:diguanylate cyclase (GGDEF)-like protein